MSIITMLYNQHEMKGPPFSVDQNEINHLYENFNIRQLANAEVKSIPRHLKERGLSSICEQLFFFKNKCLSV